MTRELYQRLLGETVEHFKATGNPDVSARGKELVGEYIAYVGNNRTKSDDFVAITSFAGMTDEQVSDLERKCLAVFV